MVPQTPLKLLFVVAVALVLLASIAPLQRLPREITKIKEYLYRFRNVGHFPVVLVTPGGIIATYPIDADARRIQMHRRKN